MGSLPETEHVLLEREGGWLTVWLNRPDVRNALSIEMVAELADLMTALRDDRDVRGITFRGKGGAFCAGGDLKGFKAVFQGEMQDEADVAAASRKAGEMFGLIETAPQVVVMLVEGVAVAGGLGMLCAGDVVAVTEDATFALTETTLGIPPAQIAPFIVSRLGLKTARRLMLTAARFDGREAMRLGLADFRRRRCGRARRGRGDHPQGRHALCAGRQCRHQGHRAGHAVSRPRRHARQGGIGIRPLHAERGGARGHFRVLRKAQTPVGHVRNERVRQHPHREPGRDRAPRHAHRQGARTSHRRGLLAGRCRAPHVRFADDAVAIGAAPAAESYLSAERILAAAREAGAEAIHPGYGFLSENAGFARACREAGLVFIGPPSDAIDLMGNKAAAKRRMIEAGVPCVPGYEGQDQSDEKFAEAAGALGFPVMVKAAAGGGGRGMRLVANAGELQGALTRARQEALSAFGSDELILEKAIVRPRHVEFQIFADTHGTTVHMGERDCSVQRRHQKVIEEAPCPVMTGGLRQRMGAAAVGAARAIGYEGAGTVEFLLGANDEFHFLEMNTRLQVEHPVTEMLTGHDLVALQIAVAQGKPLGFTQNDVRFGGHAIEARLYAEDPGHDFLPSTGTIDCGGRLT